MYVLEQVAELLGRIKPGRETAHEGDAEMTSGCFMQEEQILLDCLSQCSKRSVCIFRRLDGECSTRYRVFENGPVGACSEHCGVPGGQVVSQEVRVQLGHGLFTSGQVSVDCVALFVNETTPKGHPV